MSDTDGRFHGYPTGKRQGPVWAHQRAALIPQLTFRAPERSRKQTPPRPQKQTVAPPTNPFAP